MKKIGIVMIIVYLLVVAVPCAYSASQYSNDQLRIWESIGKLAEIAEWQKTQIETLKSKILLLDAELEATNNTLNIMQATQHSIVTELKKQQSNIPNNLYERWE